MIQELKQFPPHPQKPAVSDVSGGPPRTPVPILSSLTLAFVAITIITQTDTEPGLPSLLGWVVQGSVFQTFSVQIPTTGCAPRRSYKSCFSPLLLHLLFQLPEASSLRSHPTCPHRSVWKPFVWAILITIRLHTGNGC